MTDRQTRRNELIGLLGELPDRNRPLAVQEVAGEEREHYVLKKLLLDLNGIEPVPAFFIHPRDSASPRPAVLYNHAHGGDYSLGKEELLRERKELQPPPYGEVLAREGWISLCIDMWAFGERNTRPESALFKEMLWHGRVMWGMMVFDSLRALDYLASRPDVDARRIGTMGFSMGATMAWWIAALDTRIRVCVDICCLTDFQALIDTGGLDRHSIYYYVPGLLKHFTTAQINSLIAPRAHLSLAGTLDGLTPPEGLDRIDRELREIYVAEGTQHAWRLFRSDTGHGETPAMRAQALSFLKRHL